LAGVSQTYTISLFPPPTYAIGPVNWNITVEAYSNLKQVNTQVFSISNFQVQTCPFTFMLVSVSSVYTYDTSVTYIFQFSINSTKSTAYNSLTVGIGFPGSYGDIRFNNMVCSMDSNASCQITRNGFI
jgi:hypothetical protein